MNKLVLCLVLGAACGASSEGTFEETGAPTASTTPEGPSNPGSQPGSSSTDGTVLPETLSGRAYRVDLATGDMVNQPYGLPLGQFLLQVDQASSDGISWILATPDATGAQDLCVPTHVLPSGGTMPFDNPGFGPATAERGVAWLDLYDIQAVVGFQELKVSGAFSSDGERWVGGTFDMLNDGRWSLELNGYPPSTAIEEAEAACDIVACEPCPDGSGTYCVPWVVEGVEGEHVPGLDLIPVTEGSTDPSCD